MTDWVDQFYESRFYAWSERHEYWTYVLLVILLTLLSVVMALLFGGTWIWTTNGYTVQPIQIAP
jgi:hypothetical protein